MVSDAIYIVTGANYFIVDRQNSRELGGVKMGGVESYLGKIDKINESILANALNTAKIAAVVLLVCIPTPK